MLSYGDIQSSLRVQAVANSNPTSAEFASLVNAAVRQLMTRGNWWATVQPMEGCVSEGCVTWPRYVADVLAINAGQFPTVLQNRWYRFLPWDEATRQWGCHYFSGKGGGNLVSEMDGTSPVFNPIACNNAMYLQFYIDTPADAGKTITIFGTDGNGQTIFSNYNGIYQEGVTVTLAAPMAQTPIKISRVTRVVKAVTKGYVRGYQWDGVSMNGSAPLLSDLCQYAPLETSPQYLHTRIRGLRPNSGPTVSGACCTVARITALVKLGYVPVSVPNDPILIDNEDAIRDMIQAIKLKEARDIAGAKDSEANAFRELNYQMRDRFPIEQFTVAFRPFGNATLNTVTGGFM